MCKELEDQQMCKEIGEQQMCKRLKDWPMCKKIEENKTRDECVKNQNTHTLSSKKIHGKNQSTYTDAHKGSNSRYQTYSECLQLLKVMWVGGGLGFRV
jgi:hypothetical protein